MANCVKEEELGHDEGLDKHDQACSNDGKQTDDIEHTDSVQDDVSRASQGFLEVEEGHHE